MLKYIFALVILAKFVYTQSSTPPTDESVIPDTVAPETLTTDGKEYDVVHTQTWTENSTIMHTANFTERCHSTCKKRCVKPCPDPNKCTDTQNYCGKEELDSDVWPNCIKSDKCVDKPCECQVQNTCDDSMCDLFCPKTCDEVTEIKCGGKTNKCGCKEQEICVARPLKCNNQEYCPHFCEEECESSQIECPQDADEDCCPVKSVCKDKVTSGDGGDGKYCDIQQCDLKCEGNYTLCVGETHTSGAFTGCKKTEDKCERIEPPVSNSGQKCPDKCPVTCPATTQIKCDGTEIFTGEYSGCFTAETCCTAAKTCNNEPCPANSASHPCPEKECPVDHYLCSPREDNNCCLEELQCTECKRDKEQKCCSKAVTCHAVCKPHEKECRPPGNDDDGCPFAAVCIPVVHSNCNDGEECKLHCDGTCKENQVLCPGEINDCGCREPSFCHPRKPKKWGKGCNDEYCPGWCPKQCGPEEILCDSVDDPCNGCPTEPICKPRAKNVNGGWCFDGSASHGCDISCKTAAVGDEGGYEVICQSYPESGEAGCLGQLVCRARTKWTLNGEAHFCPAHSVCDKRCKTDERKCDQGFDPNGCKKEPMCVAIPKDSMNQTCTDFECPPCCKDEEEQYCKGEYTQNGAGQRCPKRDYCVERVLNKNDERCPGHCRHECQNGDVLVWQNGKDVMGCPWGYACMTQAEADAIAAAAEGE